MRCNFNVILTILLGAALAFRQLFESLWDDEVSGLLYFDEQPFRVFSVYFTETNNHILFNFAQSIWMELIGGLDAEIWKIRFLTYSVFIISIALTYFITKKILGEHGAVIAALMFATSHVALNYSTMLRGYGVSFLPSLMVLYFVIKLTESNKFSYLIGYGISSIIFLGILPSNCMALGVVLVTIAILKILDNEFTRTLSWKMFFSLLMFPTLSAFFYLGLFDEIKSMYSVILYQEEITPLKSVAYFSWCLIKDQWYFIIPFIGGIRIILRNKQLPRKGKFASVMVVMIICSLIVPYCTMKFAHFGTRCLVPGIIFFYIPVAYFVGQAFAQKRRYVMPMIIIFVGVLSSHRQYRLLDWNEMHGTSEHKFMNIYYQTAHESFFTYDALEKSITRAVSDKVPIIYGSSLFQGMNEQWIQLELLKIFGSQRSVQTISDRVFRNFQYIDNLTVSPQNKFYIMCESPKMVKEILDHCHLPFDESWEPRLIEDFGLYELYFYQSSNTEPMKIKIK